MLNRLWVIECQFNGDKWDICDFTKKGFSYTDFHLAHRIKREIQELLYQKGSDGWTKNRFRVKEYIPK